MPSYGLPVIKLQRVEVDNLEECGICYVPYGLGDKAYLMGCYHVYHTECLHSWWGQSFTCPCCREDCALSLGGREGEQRRMAMFGVWERERVERLQRRKITEWRVSDLRTRITELTSHPPDLYSLSRHDLIELLFLLDPATGMRITRDDSPQTPTPPTTREMLSRLREAFVDTSGIAEKDELVKLYTQTFTPGVLEVQTPTPTPPPEEDSDTLSLDYLSGLPLRDLKAIALSMNIDIKYVRERDELYELIEQSFGR